MRERVWLLNLDAEDELGAARPYAGPFAALAKRPELRTRLSSLVPSGDLVLDAAGARGAGAARGMMGLAWSMTAVARATLLGAGAVPAPAPPVSVLVRVMSRELHAEVGLPFDGSVFTRSPEVALGHLRSASPSGAWLARRAFGFAGRGRRIVASGNPSPADLAFVDGAAAQGGVLIEPKVEVLADFGLHGFLASDGEIVLGEPIANVVDRAGVWREARRAERSELAPSEWRELHEEARRAGEALARAGHFGPFGVDAFRHPGGFCARCEINARYSMGWGIGMGDRRPDLDAIAFA